MAATPRRCGNLRLPAQGFPTGKLAVRRHNLSSGLLFVTAPEGTRLGGHPNVQAAAEEDPTLAKPNARFMCTRSTLAVGQASLPVLPRPFRQGSLPTNQGPALSQASVKLDPSFDNADGCDFRVPSLLSMVISSTLPPNEPMGPLARPTVAEQVPDTDV
jgi:hypothetical protein